MTFNSCSVTSEFSAQALVSVFVTVHRQLIKLAAGYTQWSTRKALKTLSLLLILGSFSEVNAQTTSGSVGAGQALWVAHGCQGCHGNPPSGVRYNAANAAGVISYAIANVPLMFNKSGVSTADRADIAAYIASLVDEPSNPNVAVPFNSAGVAIPIPNIFFGTSFSALATVAAPGKGSVSYNGLTATYVPTPGQTGADSFTYNATGAAGTSNVRTVTVNIAAPTPPSCTLTASPTSIAAGGSSTLTASCTPSATSYAWTNSGFGAGTSGGTVSPGATTTYTVIGSNAGGAGNTASATVTVTAAPLATPTCTLTATPSSITAGGSSTLTASCSPAATSFTWTNTGFAGNADSGNVSPTSTTTYSVAGTNAAGTGSPASVSVTVTAAQAASYQGMWYNPSESGWGMSATQHSNKIFAAIYTYDAGGQPVWYVIPTCPIQTTGCTGEIYKVVGATPPIVPWNGAGKQVSSVGTVTFTFTTATTGTFSFIINGVSGSKAITKDLFATGSTPPATDYTDLWWNADESGWGVALTHLFGNIFVTWYTYDANGNAIWYVASNCTVAGNGCSGDLYQVTGGTPINTAWNGAGKVVLKVGTVTIAFTGSGAGTMNYTINGISASRAITRQGF
ncbi:hypothetical protein BH11PSE11_BH11PSE11_20540 [soil metagenome]